jgi:ABC-type nitrate/sulfonate/bicarbonate transport system substrate-binding protein
LIAFFAPFYLQAADTDRIGARIAFTTTGATQAPFYLAKELGLFKKYGLDVEAIYAPGNIAMRALVSGEVDVIGGSGAFPIVGSLQGLDNVIIAASQQFLDYQLIVLPHVEKPGDLIGKKLGISAFGTASDFSLRDILLQVRIDPSKVAIVQIGDTSTRLASLVSGHIDGTILNPPVSFMARKRGLKILVDSSELRMPYMGGAAITLRRVIRDSPEKLRRFMRAYIEATYVFKSNKEVSLSVLQKYTHIGDREILDETYSYYVTQFPLAPYPSREGIVAILKSVASRIPSATGAKPESFFDTRFVAELERDGFIARFPVK